LYTRRETLLQMLRIGGAMSLASSAWGKPREKSPVPRGPVKDPLCTVYRSVNGSPPENLRKVVELMGGIHTLFGEDDVVLIKPNAQWWNQGATNLAALSAFVDLIMERPGGFRGEVVIAENCHRGISPWTSTASGWARDFQRNAEISGIKNLAELGQSLKERYGDRFTLRHWINVEYGAKRVFGPKDGAGYVYCDGTGGVPLLSFDNGVAGDKYRATIMTYPVFVTDRGTVVDFKHGVWEKGKYTEGPFRFVNFPALNHHSVYCGLTSAVKNYLGVTDLSGGPDPHQGGKLTPQYYNFHSFPFDKWDHGPRPGMLGAEVGVFLKTVRKADLNITAAEWVGLVSRVEPPAARTRAVLASTDPVALDYHSGKYLLFPNSKMAVHDPDDRKSPLRQYLAACAEKSGCVFDENRVDVVSYDIRNKRSQNDDLPLHGEMYWGRDPKSLLKYMYLRFLPI
jgi:hypothetical protein